MRWGGHIWGGRGGTDVKKDKEKKGVRTYMEGKLRYVRGIDGVDSQ
jgi:hypothetical protein